MGGLLAGLGQGLAKGIEAGAKVYAEGTLEQIKQDAAERREMNLARITNLFAEEREEKSFSRGIKQREVEAGIAEKKEETTFQRRKGKEETLYGRRKGEEEVTFQRRKGEEEVTYQRRRLEAGKDMEAMLTFKNNLPDKTRSAIEKEVAGLISLGVPKKEALALGLSSLTKEESAEEKALLVTWRTVFAENTKGGADAVDAAKTATSVTGVDPVVLWSRIQARRARGGDPEKPAAPKETLVERAKRVKAEKDAEQAKLAAEKAKKGLISGAQVPPSSINVYEQ